MVGDSTENTCLNASSAIDASLTIAGAQATSDQANTYMEQNSANDQRWLFAASDVSPASVEACWREPGAKRSAVLLTPGRVSVQLSSTLPASISMKSRASATSSA